MIWVGIVFILNKENENPIFKNDANNIFKRVTMS
jgi:hypothetical protein